MKKIIFIIFLISFLVACNSINYKIGIKGANYYSNLYIPNIIKNNSILIGYEVQTKDPASSESNIYPELTYDLLKNYLVDNKVFLKAIYKEYNYEELFTYKISNEGTYRISKTDVLPYPREITIPDYINGIEVCGVDKFGFYGLNELIFVNMPKTITYVDSYGFSNTNLYQINYTNNYNTSAFSNTLIRNNDLRKIKLNIIEDKFVKRIKINELFIEVIIDLNGGKIIKEEIDLVISRPILENEIFLSYVNEEGKNYEIEKDQDYLPFSIKDYYRNIIGLSYKIKTKKVTDEIYSFTYLEESDSYSLSLEDNELYLSKLVLPDTYLDKKITEITAFNNKYISEVILGKYVKKIDCRFNTPNLRAIVFNEGLEHIKDACFYGTLLTEVNLPNSLKTLEKEVFAHTFIKFK